MKRIGIFYFSSTGNSLYIAKKIQEALGGKIFYIPTYSGHGDEFDQIILVTPIYSFGLPIPTLNFLTRLNKKTELITIQNYGGMIGGADRLLYEYALKNHLNIRSLFTMKMPENYTLIMSPPAFYKNAILKNADKHIAKIVLSIKNQNDHIPKRKKTKEKTYQKNKANWHLIGQRFSISSHCIQCGKCISICPAQNITFVNGKIKFADRCIACLSCFHRCPQKAILYQNKNNKKRYINPYIDEREIGKDID